MSAAWTLKETTTHQDHVIAHVLGTSILGYFIHDEALYILLDIGFVWKILLDGEMGLLPHPVAVKELEIDEAVRDQIKADLDLLLGTDSSKEKLSQFRLPPVECLIKDVGFFAAEERRRFLIHGEEQSLAIEMSLQTAEVHLMSVEDKEHQDNESASEETKLEDVARTEHDYLHQRLRDDLGREPTEAELDEWLRQHTEGY